MRTLITGATGFIGRHLIRQLETPTLLCRNPEKAEKIPGAGRAFRWDTTEIPPVEAFTDVDCLFHLAGDPVYKGRWNTEKKKRIRDSRISGTKNLVERISTLDHPPGTLISASAIGYYGSRQDEELSEQAGPGSDFLASVCSEWEEEARKAEQYGVRVIQIRIGVVLGRDGGALDQMLLPFRLGLGGRLGNGSQYMSWIHIDDLVGIMLFAARTKEISGPVNGVSPNPVTNREFTRALASSLNRPAFFPVPEPVLRLALGEFASVLLGSQRVLPAVIQKHGYSFQYADLRQTLTSLV